MKFSFKTIACGTCAVLMAGTVMLGATVGHAGEDDIKYRKAVMKAIGGHMGAISTILKTDAGDIKDATVHADAMAGLAKVTATMFPEGSGPMDGETEALPAVWEKPAEFKEVTMAFVAATEKLAMAAKSGDKGEIGAALGMVGKDGCKACHDNFRQKK